MGFLERVDESRVRTYLVTLTDALRVHSDPHVTRWESLEIFTTFATQAIVSGNSARLVYQKTIHCLVAAVDDKPSCLKILSNLSVLRVLLFHPFLRGNLNRN